VGEPLLSQKLTLSWYWKK